MSRYLPLALAVSFLAWTGAVCAADRPPIPEFDVADRLMPDDPMPERQTAWSNTAVTLTDVVYATIPGFRALHLDLYRPVRANGPLPLVVFLHGGAWAFANPRAGAAFRNLPVILSHLAETGYVVAAVEYRFSGEAPFPAQVEDAQAAIRFLRANGGRLGIDGTRVGLWGMSAGAYLAAMAAMNCADEKLRPGMGRLVWDLRLHERYPRRMRIRGTCSAAGPTVARGRCLSGSVRSGMRTVTIRRCCWCTAPPTSHSYRSNSPNDCARWERRQTCCSFRKPVTASSGRPRPRRRTICARR